MDELFRDFYGRQVSANFLKLEVYMAKRGYVNALNWTIGKHSADRLEERQRRCRWEQENLDVSSVRGGGPQKKERAVSSGVDLFGKYNDDTEHLLLKRACCVALLDKDVSNIRTTALLLTKRLDKEAQKPLSTRPLSSFIMQTELNDFSYEYRTCVVRFFSQILQALDPTTEDTMSTKAFLDMPQLGDRFCMLDRYPAWFRQERFEKESSSRSETVCSSDLSSPVLAASSASSVDTTIADSEEDVPGSNDEFDNDGYEEDEDDEYGQILELGTAIAVPISKRNQAQMKEISGNRRTEHERGHDGSIWKATSVNVGVHSSIADPLLHSGMPQIVTISGQPPIPSRIARRQAYAIAPIDASVLAPLAAAYVPQIVCATSSIWLVGKHLKSDGS
ncbi:MAG: hypothetical protein Q9160_004802 [Pyrenula sp. 1 TL-2023]